MNKKTIIIDCDGVLYPASMLTLSEFVNAMKDTFHNDLQVDTDTQARVSQQTINNNQ